MAHKLRVKPVPHINRDGSVGTKNEYRVVCRRRGHICTDETFKTRRAADKHVEDHWAFINAEKSRRASLQEMKQTVMSTCEGVSVRINVNTRNFSDGLARIQGEVLGVKVA